MSGFYQYAERLMGMNDAVWERHANPLSVYGWAWAAVVLALLWIWLNPRLFAPPRDLDNWASRGVLGERVFLTHADQIAAHHKQMARWLSLGSIPGALAMALGLWWLDAPWTVFGMLLTMLPKIWFVDRMVWIYADWLREQEKELGDV